MGKGMNDLPEVDKNAAKSVERLHTLFVSIFFFTPFILFPLLSYRFSDWWLLLSIPVYFLGGWLYKLRIIFYIIGAILVVYLIIKGFYITLPVYLFMAACLGCYAMMLAHKYRMLSLEYKKFENDNPKI